MTKKIILISCFISNLVLSQETNIDSIYFFDFIKKIKIINIKSDTNFILKQKTFDEIINYKKLISYKKIKKYGKKLHKHKDTIINFEHTQKINFNYELNRKLELIYKKDQDYRKNRNENDKWNNTVDSLNFIELKQILTNYPSLNYINSDYKHINMFGIIINHAIYDSSLVNINKLHEYLYKGSISPLMFALALDKYYVLVKKEQSFFYLFSIDKFENLKIDKKNIIIQRRLKYGLNINSIFDI